MAVKKLDKAAAKHIIHPNLAAQEIADRPARQFQDQAGATEMSVVVTRNVAGLHLTGLRHLSHSASIRASLFFLLRVLTARLEEIRRAYPKPVCAACWRSARLPCRLCHHLRRQERWHYINDEGVTLFAQRDYKQALEFFDYALTLHSQDPILIFNMAQCYDRLGDLTAPNNITPAACNMIPSTPTLAWR